MCQSLKIQIQNRVRSLAETCCAYSTALFTAREKGRKKKVAKGETWILMERNSLFFTSNQSNPPTYIYILFLSLRVRVEEKLIGIAPRKKGYRRVELRRNVIFMSERKWKRGSIQRRARKG